MPAPLINDEDGKLTEIARLAEQPNPETTETVQIEGANIKGSMHEAVQAALNEDVDSPSTEEQSAQPNEEKVETKVDDKKEDVILDDETQETPEQKRQREADETAFNERLDKHPRFQEVITERNTLRPLADWAKVELKYQEDNRITPEQKKQAMELLALMNSDPKKAVEALTTIITDLKLNVGLELPVDLQKEVTDGTMSKERATEFHRLRIEKAQLEQGQKVQQQQQVQSNLSQISSAMDNYAAVIAKSDPDFKKKAKDTDPDGKFEMVLDRIKLHSMEKYPATPNEAIEIVKKAYAYAQRFYSRTSPTPRSRRILNGDSRSSESTSPELKDGETMQQYVARTAGRRHGLSIAGSN